MLSAELSNSQGQLLIEALVVDRDATGSTMLVEFTQESDTARAWVKTTLSAASAANGDRVLVMGSNIDQLFAIDILSGPPSKSRTQAPAAVTLREGATAAVVEQSGRESLQLVSSGNELLVEYDPAIGQMTIHSTGNTRLIVDRGDLDLSSAGDVRLAGKSVRMAAWDDVTVVTGRPGQSQPSSLKLDGRSMRLSTHSLEVSSDVLSSETRQISAKADRFDGQIAESNLRGTMLRVQMKTIVQQAGDMYNTVKGLVQCFAGRMRTSVDSSVHLQSNEISLNADDDVRIQGEQIHLG